MWVESSLSAALARIHRYLPNTNQNRFKVPYTPNPEKLILINPNKDDPLGSSTWPFTLSGPVSTQVRMIRSPLLTVQRRHRKRLPGVSDSCNAPAVRTHRPPEHIDTTLERFSQESYPGARGPIDQRCRGHTMQCRGGSGMRRYAEVLNPR